MYWLNLPAPESGRSPAFGDLAGARAWLAAQPQAQPLLMQNALAEQVSAIDAAGLPPNVVVSLLNLLHGAIVPAQTSLEIRFTRRPLPMAGEEEKIFLASQKLWTRLAIAYLRPAPHFAPRDKVSLLFRAANALRMAQFNHFQASRECPPELDQWLCSILIQASSAGILRIAEVDPHFRHFGEANIAGILAWAFLLRLVNPYHLSGPQLVVANRALSRWRELCDFRVEVDPAAPQHDISLSARLGADLPGNTPSHLNIHAIIRKIHSRVVSLRTGATTDSLKLGRELSPTACIRLLGDIEQRLRHEDKAPAGESGEISLSFGTDQAYAVFREETGTPVSGEAHAVFPSSAEEGFDTTLNFPPVIQKSSIPCENWKLANGTAKRAAGNGLRRSSPCLIAARMGTLPRLGVLRSLLTDIDGMLTADPDWFTGKVEACCLQQPGLRDTHLARIPVFVISSGQHLSLILPGNAPIRPGIGLALEGEENVYHLVPTEVIDRGLDFVHYACRNG